MKGHCHSFKSFSLFCRYKVYYQTHTRTTSGRAHREVVCSVKKPGRDAPPEKGVWLSPLVRRSLVPSLDHRKSVSCQNFLKSLMPLVPKLISFPGQESNPGPLCWQHRVLTAGLPGKSHLFLCSYINLCQKKHTDF